MEMIVLLLFVGAGILGLGLQSRILANRTTREIEARSAADAGLTRAIFEMNEQLKVRPWTEVALPEATGQTLANCSGTYSYAVTGDITSGYAVQSTGVSSLGRAQRTINGTLRLQGPFECAIASRAALILKSLTRVDGYNSSDPTITDVEAKIATNSTLPEQIVLNSGVKVDGSVLVGVGGDPSTVIMDLGAETGLRYPMWEDIYLPPVTPPALPDMGTDIYVKGATLNITPAMSGTYTDIGAHRKGSDMTAQYGILVISGGDVVLHITGDILLGQGCELIVKDGSSLKLYADGNIICREGSGIGNEGNPGSLRIYGTGDGPQTFDLKAKTKWSGAVYAPNADITIRADGDVYGSVVANSVEFKAGGNFYYDEALKEVSVDDEALRFVINRWQEQ
jgi:hypothetical protein